MSPRTGRPPLDDPRRHVDSVRTTDAERELMQAAAAKAGQPLGAWMRDRLIAAAKRAR